jgi:hypothetical protein
VDGEIAANRAHIARSMMKGRNNLHIVSRKYVSSTQSLFKCPIAREVYIEISALVARASECAEFGLMYSLLLRITCN